MQFLGGRIVYQTLQSVYSLLQISSLQQIRNMLTKRGDGEVCKSQTYKKTIFLHDLGWSQYKFTRLKRLNISNNLLREAIA